MSINLPLHFWFLSLLFSHANHPHYLFRLLRKVDFLTYKSDNNHRAATIRSRYHLTGSLDYEKYNRLAGSARQLAHKISALDPSDPFRKKVESEMLEKFFNMGILKQSREQGAGLSRIEHDVTVSAFARRRLGVMMARSGMVEHVPAVRSSAPRHPALSSAKLTRVDISGHQIH